MRISDWSSDVCSSDLAAGVEQGAPHRAKVIGGVDQQARATAGRDAPAGVVLLEDGCVVLGGHVLRQGHGVKGRLSPSRRGAGARFNNDLGPAKVPAARRSGRPRKEKGPVATGPWKKRCEVSRA